MKDRHWREITRGVALFWGQSVHALTETHTQTQVNIYVCISVALFSVLFYIDLHIFG